MRLNDTVIRLLETFGSLKDKTVRIVNFVKERENRWLTIVT